MSNLILIQAILFVLLAIMQGFMALTANLAVRDRRDRWVFTAVLLFVGLANLSTVLYLGEVTAVSQLWLAVRLALNLVNPLLLLLFVLSVLRRNWATTPVAVVLVTLALIPAVLVGADQLGYSQQVFGTNLIGQLPQSFNLSVETVLNTLQFATGPVGAVYALVARGSLVLGLAMCLVVAVLDWRSNRYQAISALILGLAFAAVVATVFLGGMLTNGSWYFLLGQYLFTFGLGYIGLRYNNEAFSLRGFGSLIADWPMLKKLLLAVLGVLIPAIALLTISSILFFQARFIEGTGTDLELLAESESQHLEDTLGEETRKLGNLADDAFTQSLLSTRAASYATLDDAGIAQQLAQGEQTWLAGEANNEFVTAILSSARNQHLLEFQRLFPEHQAMILTDAFGGTVTATEYVEHYDWSSEIWWQIVSQNGFPFIEFTQAGDDSVVLQIAVPVQTDADPSDVEGVLLSRYDFTDTMVAMYEFNAQAPAGLALFQSNWGWMAPPRDLVRQTNPGLNSVALESDPTQRWQVLSYNGEDHVVAYAPVSGNISQLGNMNWRVVAYRPASDSLAALGDARWGALILGGGLLLAATLLTLVIARQVTRPLSELSALAGRIQAGERELDFPPTGGDEIGELSTSFRTMVDEINRMVTGLEESVRVRTEDLEQRALQLETSSLVAREAASIRELETLLNSVTQLITERFGFYHTGIFLLDEEEEFAVLRAANSPGGQRMLGRGHKLQVGKVGVVGYAAGVGEPRLAQDVGADVVYYANPDMPDTRSELALPMRVRDRVIGVLDVQSTRTNAFSAEDINVLENLTDQIALAIDNARLLESSQRALEELQYLYGQRAAQAWRQRLANDPLELYYDASGFRNAPPQIEPSNRVAGPVMYQDIIFRGQVIGTIELERENPELSWTAEEQGLVAEIMDQAALALENARLVDQIRLRSDQIQLLQEVTALSASLKSEGDMLHDVAVRLQEGLGVYYTSVVLLDHEKQESRVAATARAEQAPQLDYLSAHRFPMAGNAVLADLLREREITVLTDVQGNPRVQNSYYKHYHQAPTLVIAPLIARNEVIGTLELALIDPTRRLDDEEMNLIEQISAQLATALDSTRLFTQTASRAERERLVADITTKVRASNDPNTIIETAVSELRKALNAKHAQIVIDGERENGAPENGSDEHTNGHGSAEAHEQSSRSTD